MELLQPCAYQYRPITCGSFLRGLSRLLWMSLLQKGTRKWLLVWWSAHRRVRRRHWREVIFESKRKLQALVCEAQVTGSMFVSWQLYCSCPLFHAVWFFQKRNETTSCFWRFVTTNFFEKLGKLVDRRRVLCLGSCTSLDMRWEEQRCGSESSRSVTPHPIHHQPLWP
jgi:hypothetical protein